MVAVRPQRNLEQVSLSTWAVPSSSHPVPHPKPQILHNLSHSGHMVSWLLSWFPHTCSFGPLFSPSPTFGPLFSPSPSLLNSLLSQVGFAGPVHSGPFQLLLGYALPHIYNKPFPLTIPGRSHVLIFIQLPLGRQTTRLSHRRPQILQVWETFTPLQINLNLASLSERTGK